MDHGRHLSTRLASAGRSWAATVRAVLCRDDGIAAVEFALLAPMLIFSVMATVDLGLAISERLTIGHILRAGAQSVTEGAGIARIDLVLRTIAAKNMTVAVAGAAGTDRSLSLAVRQICACAAQPSTAVACATTCAQNAPTQVFYILTGSKTYAGLILPRFAQSKSLEVQVR
ncbi:MAG: pilus assembly protein [Pseudorhodobacter sp.]|nr:pilus assembly protein [Pseudorhodobacter sp.]